MNRSNGNRVTGLWVRAAAGVVLAAAAIGGSAGSAWAQVRVSGIEHLPMGGATLGPVTERRLPVSNLGSSGQDGVEVRLDSAFGGAMSIDLDGLLAPSTETREIRIRPKGWDGTIKGSMRLASRPPDGTPGSSLDVGCNFAQVGALTVRVRVRDQSGVVTFDRVVAGPNVQCVVSMSPPALTIPTCGVAIKVKGTGAENNRVISVDFGDVPCDVSGLGSVTLHEVRSIEFEPETCTACDTWVGTESALITSVGLPSIVVSDASLGTFGVSSHALGGADVDEDCGDFTDCDNVRRLHVSNIGSSGQDGVAIDLQENSIGAAVTFDCFAGGLPVRPVAMEAWFDTSDGTGPIRMRVSREVDALSGQETITCDASEMDVTAIDIYCFDSGGAMLHSHREPTAVFGLACTAGAESRTQETWSCLHQRWSIDMTTPDTLVLVGGVSVPGVSSVSLVPRLAAGNVPLASRRMVMFGGQGTESIDIKHVNDPPTVVRVGGIQAIAMDKGLIAEQPDGSVVISTPCCDNDSDDDGLPDGIEMLYSSEVGGTMTVDAGPLLAPSTSTREIKIRPKGWDGTIKGHIRMAGGGGGGGAGGTIGVDCDFTPMGAVRIDWEARDVDGELLASGTSAGSTLGGITVTPDPTAALLMPALMKAKEKANRTKCSMVIPDRDCDVDGLGTTTLHNVRSIEFTPIEPAGSPPWADLESMQATFAGMPSLHVLDASLLTFDAQIRGKVNATAGEQCDSGLSCDSSRKIRVENLGSSGQDGVEIRLGNPLINEVSLPNLGGASFDLARGNCCRGHVIIMKLYDDQDQEAARVSNSSDADQNTHTLSFDGSASGVEGYTVVLRDAADTVLGVVDVFGSGGDISYIGPCDASETRTFSFNSTSIRMELCESPVTVFLGGIPVAGVSSVSMDCRTGMQWVPESLTGVDVTGNPTDFIQVSNFALIEGEPPCVADFDGDGVRGVPDIFAFLSAWFAQSPGADMNGDGSITVPDIFAFLSLWFAGCP